MIKSVIGNIINAALVLLLLQSSVFAAKVPQENFIIAKVNNKAITNLEFKDRYRFVIKMTKISVKNSQDRNLLQNRLIDKMIDEELIRQEAEKLKIKASEEEIRNAIDVAALRKKMNATQLKLFLNRRRISFNNYVSQIESEILWTKIISKILRSKVKVTEVEVKEFFEQQKYDISVRKFLIAEILIANGTSRNSETLAKKLVTELRNGADFENVVEQFSSGFSAENDGKIGWVSQGDVDARIYQALTKLKKYDYSEPILLSNGYHIFKLLDAKTESEINDKDYNRARDAIFIRKLQTVAHGYLMDLRKNAFVEVKL